MAEVQLEGSEIRERVAALGPQIEAAADEGERDRCVPQPVVDALTTAGVFRMAMPRAWGGPEVPLVEQVEILEEISRHDASTGWISMILSDSGYYSGYLADEVARQVYPSLDLRTAGLLAPVGRAEVVEGGYRVSGRWSFGSGILHADRIVGGCLVWRDGELVMDGEGPYRAMILPRDSVEIHDTWHTAGLRGTGSNDYSATDALVPVEHSFNVFDTPVREGALYGYHGTFFTNLPGVALGAAEHALDAFVELAAEKLLMPSMTLLRDDAKARTTFAEASALVAAARALVRQTLVELQDVLEAGETPSLELRARVGMTMIQPARMCRQAVEALCDVAATSAIFQRNVLERLRRDMATMCAHVVTQHRTFESVGQLLFGEVPAFSLF